MVCRHGGSPGGLLSWRGLWFVIAMNGLSRVVDPDPDPHGSESALSRREKYQIKQKNRKNASL